MATNAPPIPSIMEVNEAKQEPSSERSEASRGEHPSFIIECANGAEGQQRHEQSEKKDEQLGGEGDASLTAKRDGGDENENEDDTAFAAEILRSLAASKWQKDERQVEDHAGIEADQEEQDISPVDAWNDDHHMMQQVNAYSRRGGGGRGGLKRRKNNSDEDADYDVGRDSDEFETARRPRGRGRGRGGGGGGGGGRTARGRVEPKPALRLTYGPMPNFLQPAPHASLEALMSGPGLHASRAQPLPGGGGGGGSRLCAHSGCQGQAQLSECGMRRYCAGHMQIYGVVPKPLQRNLSAPKLDEILQLHSHPLLTPLRPSNMAEAQPPAPKPSNPHHIPELFDEALSINAASINHMRANGGLGVPGRVISTAGGGQVSTSLDLPASSLGPLTLGGGLPPRQQEGDLQALMQLAQQHRLQQDAQQQAQNALLQQLLHRQLMQQQTQQQQALSMLLQQQQQQEHVQQKILANHTQLRQQSLAPQTQAQAQGQQQQVTLPGIHLQFPNHVQVQGLAPIEPILAHMDGNLVAIPPEHPFHPRHQEFILRQRLIQQHQAQAQQHQAQEVPRVQS